MGKLFATTIANAKPIGRDYKLTDGAGLYLLVKPNGRKLWRLNYAHLGKQRTLSFGAWPEVGLADARAQRDDARRMIAAGLDPSHEKKLATTREMIAEENSFKVVAEEWLAKNEREDMADVTLAKIRWLLDKAYPRRQSSELCSTSGATVKPLAPAADDERQLRAPIVVIQCADRHS